MFKFIVAAAIVTTAVATPAFAGDAVSAPFRFRAEGSTFSGIRTDEAGVTTLRGREHGGKPFLLRVQDNRVTGTFGAHPVSFPVPASEVNRVVASR